MNAVRLAGKLWRDDDDDEDVVELMFVHRGPTWLSLDSPNPLPGTTGVCFLSVLFQGAVHVSFIRFKNYYVSTITIIYKTLEDDAISTPTGSNSSKGITDLDSSGSTAVVCSLSNVPWKTWLRRQTLMPDADYEDCSQDYFNMTANECGRFLKNVTGMIFILRQPSYRWKTFAIRELAIYGKNGAGCLASCEEPDVSSSSHGCMDPVSTSDHLVS